MKNNKTKITQKDYEALGENQGEREWGMLNVYICPKLHFTFTIDRDLGVTPFMIRCEHRQQLASHSKRGANLQCKETAKSEMYRVPAEYSDRATHEFYRPSFEYFKKIKSEALKEHLANGGLAFRKIGDLDCYQ